MTPLVAHHAGFGSPQSYKTEACPVIDKQMPDTLIGTGGHMVTRISRVSPFQAGKVSAVLYFIFGIVFSLPFAVIFALLPPAHTANGAAPPGPMMFLFFPFLYALAGLIFVPIMCWLYNLVAKLVGGIEIQLSETGNG